MSLASYIVDHVGVVRLASLMANQANVLRLSYRMAGSLPGFQLLVLNLLNAESSFGLRCLDFDWQQAKTLVYGATQPPIHS